MAKKHEPKKTPITVKKSPAPPKPSVPEKAPVSTIKSHALTKTKAPGKVRVPEKVHIQEKVKASEKPPIPEEIHVSEQAHTPEKSPARTRKVPPDKSIPSMTEEQTQAYMKFSEACKEVYDQFGPDKIDTRLIELKSSPALIAVVRFMVMLHDLLRMHGVMKFNKLVSPTLYKHLDAIQEQTGQELPLARVLLDGIKMTKMELLSGVTPHPLPDFQEPEYTTGRTKIPDPADDSEEPEEKTVMPDQKDDEFESQESPEGEEAEPAGTPGEVPSHVGPGGPYFDDSVQPQSGTPIEPPKNLPVSIDEEEELEEAE
jgi:hypothetical protein